MKHNYVAALCALMVMATLAACGDKEEQRQPTPNSVVQPSVRTWPDGALEDLDSVLYVTNGRSPRASDTIHFLRGLFCIYYDGMTRDEFRRVLPSDFSILRLDTVWYRGLGDTIPEEGIFLALTYLDQQEAIRVLKGVKGVHHIERVYEHSYYGDIPQPMMRISSTKPTLLVGVEEKDTAELLHYFDSLNVVIVTRVQETVTSSIDLQPMQIVNYRIGFDHSMYDWLKMRNDVIQRFPNLYTWTGQPNKRSYWIDVSILPPWIHDGGTERY